MTRDELFARYRGKSNAAAPKKKGKPPVKAPAKDKKKTPAPAPIPPVVEDEIPVDQE